MPEDQTPTRKDDDELYAIALACTRGREAIVSRFRELLGRNDLTEQQWRVMRAMYEVRSMETTDLCARCCIHKVSMMRILRTLMERGLLEREQDRQDKRRHIVSITGAGDALIVPILPAARQIYDDILDRLGRSKARQLVALLDELAQLQF
ncbi:MAG: winged helix DNA-binding protein [Hyphomicrobiales bacterium]|nr:winged helix DNA-binding protein [Hyphomicrobiales bacterium]